MSGFVFFIIGVLFRFYYIKIVEKFFVGVCIGIKDIYCLVGVKGFNGNCVWYNFYFVSNYIGFVV